jgi:hypothetical protein
MPVYKIQKGETTYYRWGQQGKLYRTKKQALAQARAAYAAGYKKK